MKFFKTLTLAAAVMVGSAAWAGHAVNSMDVQFPKGANSAELTGTVSGYDYDVYTFRANKGQLLTLNLHGSDPQIETRLFFDNKANSSNRLSQVLPYTGKYELRVGQSRNDARKDENIARQYNLELKIENKSKAKPNNSWVSYTCSGRGKLKVKYKGLNGNSPSATVQYKGKNYNLSFDRQFSRYGEVLVLSSKNYSLSLDRSQTKDPYDAQVYSFNKLDHKGNDAAVVQDCQPQ